MEVEADVLHRVSARQPCHLQHRLADLDFLLWEEIGQRAADHHSDDVLHGGLLAAQIGDLLAVTEDHDPIRDAEHLLQAVGDEDDGHSLSAQALHRLKQRLDLVAGQGRGRLIHDDQLCLGGQRFGDLHLLALRHGQPAHQGVRRDLGPDAVEQLLGFPLHEAVVDHPQPAHEPAAVHDAAQEDVLVDALVEGQVQLLVDGADAHRLSLVGGEQSRLFALVDEAAAAVGLVDAAHDLHQRRFAGAVLADQADDLAPRDVEIDVVQGAHAREGLGDVLHAQ